MDVLIHVNYYNYRTNSRIASAKVTSEALKCTEDRSCMHMKYPAFCVTQQDFSRVWSILLCHRLFSCVKSNMKNLQDGSINILPAR